MCATIIQSSQIIKNAHQYCSPNEPIAPNRIDVTIIINYKLYIKEYLMQKAQTPCQYSATEVLRKP